MVAAHGYESVIVALYKYRPDTVQSLGVLLLYEREQSAKMEYMGNMLYNVACIMSAFGGVKEPSFPSFSKIFRRDTKEDDKRSADDIISGLCKRLKRMKKKKG